MRAEWEAFAARFATAADDIRGHVDQLRGQAVLSPTFDVVREVKAMPWEAMVHTPVRDALEVSAATTFARSYRATRRDPYRKDAADRAEEDVDLVLSDQLALDWLEQRGLDLATRVSERSRATVVDVLRDAVSNGRSIPGIVADIKDVVGLNQRQADALAAQRDRLRERGLSEEKVRARVDRYRKKLIRSRAETIARTEMVAARNQGQVHAWVEMARVGELPAKSRKVWLDAERLACPICRELASHDPIPVGSMFSSTDVGLILCPPAHPNCRCSVGIA